MALVIIHKTSSWHSLYLHRSKATSHSSCGAGSFFHHTGDSSHSPFSIDVGLD